MSGFSIGLSGLDVALRAIETAGNNIANAATDGYHRQEIRIVPIASGGTAGVKVGAGARVAEVRRLFDAVTETEILRRRPLLAQTEQELATLQSLESILGDLSTDGLGTAMSRFFNALTELAGEPESAALRDQVVWAGDALAVQFRSIAGALRNISSNLRVEAGNLLSEVNTLTADIADLNGRIRDLHYRGTPDGNLLDQRDQAVSRLAGLLDIEVRQVGDGTVAIQAAGAALVTGSTATALELGTATSGSLGIGIAGARYFELPVSGGRLGAIFALEGDLLPQTLGSLDTLAGEILGQINRHHVQGIGTAGSFTRLDGQVVDGDLGTWQPPLAAGTLAVRITDTATGAVVRETVAVDPSADSLSDVAARLDALAGLKASVVASRLHLEAEPGYTFDFLPGALPTPTTSTLTGTASPAVSGAYAGQANQVLTATVVGTGSVGVTPGLAVEVRDGGGALVATLTVGLGYAAGQALDTADGLRVALSAGTLNDGETFTVEALAWSDPTGLLAGAGLNAFFSGTSAETMYVMADLKASSARLAAAALPAGTDNLNLLRMVAAGDTRLAALGDLTPAEYYGRLVAGVGQEVVSREARRDGLDLALKQLVNHRDALSGVDVNDEAAGLILFEQLFQAMAKYLASVVQAHEALFEMV